MTNFSQQEQPDSVHQTAPGPSEVFTTRESLRERCEMFVRCLPQAPMRDRLARLFEDLLAGQWQPIATAPKDGTAIHVSWGTSLIGLARFIDVREAYEHWDRSQPGWYGTLLPGWIDIWMAEPKCWMPLPAAPHHRSAGTERHGSDKPESDSESDSGFAALRAVPHQPTGERK